MIRAGDIMTRRVISVSEETSLEDLCGLLFEARITGAPVVDADGVLVGIVSKDDIVGVYVRGGGRGQVAGGEPPTGIGEEQSSREARERTSDEPPGKGAGTVGDIMTREVLTVAEDTPVAEICDIMVTRGIHRVPVVREGRVLGIVSSLNVLEAFLEGKLAK